jgi:endonuclease III
MKITIETKQTETIEIQTPAFYKSEWSNSVYYINDDVIINVMDDGIVSYKKEESIFNNQAVMISKHTPIIQDEFETRFDETIAKLISLKPNYKNERNSL